MSPTEHDGGTQSTPGDRPARRRPSYGLPGPASQPTPAAPPSADDASAAAAAPTPSQHTESSAAPSAPATQAPTPGGSPAPFDAAPAYPAATAPAPRRKTRGVIPMVIGLLMLLVLAPVLFVGGIIWSMSSLVGDAARGPQPIPAQGIEVEANHMLTVYVPSEEAAGATCTAEGAQPGAVTAVPSSGSATFGDGSSYEQVLGVVATSDTTVTITCEGTDSPAYLGPFNIFGLAAPMLIGPILGIVVGLIGLVLAIIGLVMLLRSRRA